MWSPVFAGGAQTNCIAICSDKTNSFESVAKSPSPARLYFYGFCYTKKPFRRIGMVFISVKTNYSAMSVTTPEPTVLPPSRIANLRPFSIAIGVISSTFILTLSPGIHISTPSGSEITPVTSVVLK